MRQSRLIGLVENRKYWIFDGYNGGSKMGSWGGQRYTLNTTQIKLNTIANSTSRANVYNSTAISVTNYRKLVFVVTSASGTTNGGYRRAGVATSTNTSPTNYVTIPNSVSSATRYVLDISSLTGNRYINIYVSPKSGSNTSETIIRQIWLE